MDPVGLALRSAFRMAWYDMTLWLENWHFASSILHFASRMEHDLYLYTDERTTIWYTLGLRNLDRVWNQDQDQDHFSLIYICISTRSLSTPFLRGSAGLSWAGLGWAGLG